MRDTLESTVSVFIGDLDQPGRQKVQRCIDMAENGLAAFGDPVFHERFNAFQRELGQAGRPEPGAVRDRGEREPPRLPRPSEPSGPRGADEGIGQDPDQAGAGKQSAKPWWKFWRRG